MHLQGRAANAALSLSDHGKQPCVPGVPHRSVAADRRASTWQILNIVAYAVPALGVFGPACCECVTWSCSVHLGCFFDLTTFWYEGCDTSTAFGSKISVWLPQRRRRNARTSPSSVRGQRRRAAGTLRGPSSHAYSFFHQSSMKIGSGDFKLDYSCLLHVSQHVS